MQSEQDGLIASGMGKVTMSQQDISITLVEEIKLVEGVNYEIVVDLPAILGTADVKWSIFRR